MADSEKNRFQEIIDGLKSNKKEEKLLSIAALGILRIKQHGACLVDLLSSPDLEVVEQVIKALGNIGDSGSVKHIVDFIVGDNARLSDIAYKALKGFDFAPALDALINACSSDQPPATRKKLVELLFDYQDVRISALINEVLGQTRDPELLSTAISYFINNPSSERHTSLKMLSGSDNWHVSLMANIALSRLKDEGALAQIRRLIKSSNSEVRQIIAEALVKHPLIEDRPLFSELFEDSRPRIRELATEGLSLFGADERISILKRWLSAENDQRVRLLLLKKARNEKSALLYDEFYRLLQVSDDLIRSTSIEAIADMGDKIVDRILIDFDRMPLVVREQMIIVLGRIGGEKVLGIIKDSLLAKERWLRINAVEAAALVSSPELDAELVKQLEKNDTDIWVRATAVSTLGRSGDQKYADIIARQIDHSDARVRANSVEALSLLDWPQLPEICHKLLKDRNDRVRVNAAIALWKSGHEEVFNELEKMARDKSRWVRSSAVFALGKIGDHQGTPILLKMLEDQEDIVYRNAVDALSKQGDMRAMLPLLHESRKGRLSQEFFEKALNQFALAIHSGN